MYDLGGDGKFRSRSPFFFKKSHLARNETMGRVK
jgi:hypothetical protein